MPPNRHVVLPRGVPSPPELPRVQLRNQIRAEWGIQSDQIVVLNIARVVRDKGVFELLEAMSLAVARNPKLICVLVGSNPAFDETSRVARELTQAPNLGQRVRLLPTCSPEKIWEYLCAADIFVFPSHREGMPNSLLEAMVMGLPAIAFSIPPVLELEATTGCMVLVPPFDSTLLARAIVDLAASPDARASIGEKGRSRVMHHFTLRDNAAAALRLLASVVAERAASKG
jgi:glycosyltransferase involved in cell wall biosynthesis